ncbi:MAG TPA: hypothetical protein VG733_10405 [Chthoniobacteraceae bacterium]|nr:hypothetical protein [Chthoniobacteraceae bacterium]
MKQPARRLVLAAAACCFCVVARGDGPRNDTLTVAMYNQGWKVTVTVPPGWAGKVARVKRPRLPDADVYSVAPGKYAWDSPPGDAVYPPGDDGSPVVLLWTPAKGPVCVLALGFFWLGKHEAPAPPAHTAVVKLKGRHGESGFYRAWPIAAGKIREPGFGRVEAVKEARGVYDVKQWRIVFDVLVGDMKSADESMQALKIVQQRTYVPWIIGTKG